MKTLKPLEEYKERIVALHPKYFVKEDVEIDEKTWEHDKKGTVGSIEDALTTLIQAAVEELEKQKNGEHTDGVDVLTTAQERLQALIK